MNTITLGIRNAFRNATRSLSIVIILGLSIGLSLVMLIAHQAVGQKIAEVKSSIGNTVSIAPAGYNSFSSANNALTSSQLSKVASLAHVTNVDETLTDRLTTTGSAQPSFFGGNNSNSSNNSTNQTSLTSPVTFDVNGNGGGGGGGFHVFINGGRQLPANFSPPISIVGTNDPMSLNGSNLALSSGSAINGSKDEDQAMVSSDMASKNGLKVGSTFTAYGTILTIAGIFSSSTKVAENNIVVSLPTEQRLSGQGGNITNAVATVDSVDNLSSTTTAIQNTLGSSADVTNSQDQVNQAVQPLNNVKNISLYSLIGAVVAGSIIILLTMVMIVRERRREIGILKAIGASNTRIIFQFMSEALTFTIIAAFIGLLVGVIGGNPVTNMLVTNSVNSANSTSSGSLNAGPGFASTSGQGPVTSGGGGPFGFARRAPGLRGVSNNLHNLHASIGWSTLIYGLGAAVAIAAVGSAVAGWLIARVRPSEVMRAE
jgi:putative ABC transport system permease protein